MMHVVLCIHYLHSVDTAVVNSDGEDPIVSGLVGVGGSGAVAKGFPDHEEPCVLIPFAEILCQGKNIISRLILCFYSCQIKTENGQKWTAFLRASPSFQRTCI